eukprot:5550-Heterococcus_DN1.PRE.10
MSVHLLNASKQNTVKGTARRASAYILLQSATSKLQCMLHVLHYQVTSVRCMVGMSMRDMHRTVSNHSIVKCDKLLTECELNLMSAALPSSQVQHAVLVHTQRVIVVQYYCMLHQDRQARVHFKTPGTILHLALDVTTTGTCHHSYQKLSRHRCYHISQLAFLYAFNIPQVVRHIRHNTLHSLPLAVAATPECPHQRSAVIKVAQCAKTAAFGSHIHDVAPYAHLFRTRAATAATVCSSVCYGSNQSLAAANSVYCAPLRLIAIAAGTAMHTRDIERSTQACHRCCDSVHACLTSRKSLNIAVKILHMLSVFSNKVCAGSAARMLPQLSQSTLADNYLHSAHVMLACSKADIVPPVLLHCKSYTPCSESGCLCSSFTLAPPRTPA